MTPEGKVKEWLKGQLKRLLPGCFLYWPHGGPFGKAGMPDLIGVWGGVAFAIEVKALGNTLDPLQLKRLMEFQLVSGVAAVIKGKDEFRLAAIVAEVKRRAEWIRQMPGPIKPEPEPEEPKVV